jgi:hypothetical protein
VRGRVALGVALGLALLGFVWVGPYLLFGTGQELLALALSSSVTSLLVSLAAAFVALRARRAAKRLEADLLLLARSVDMAMGDIVTRTDQNMAEIESLAAKIARNAQRQALEIARLPANGEDSRLPEGHVNGFGGGPQASGVKLQG